MEQLQADVDDWLHYYNEERLHSGRYCYIKTATQAFREEKHLADERILLCQVPLWANTRNEHLTGIQPAQNRLTTQSNL